MRERVEETAKGTPVEEATRLAAAPWICNICQWTRKGKFKSDPDY